MKTPPIGALKRTSSTFPDVTMETSQCFFDVHLTYRMMGWKNATWWLTLTSENSGNLRLVLRFKSFFHRLTLAVG